MEVRFGGINTVTGVEFGLHTRHRAHCLHHLVKYIQNNNLEGRGGGGRERRWKRKERKEGGGREEGGRDGRKEEGAGRMENGGDYSSKLMVVRLYYYCIAGNFRGFCFCGSRPVRKNHENLHPAKISCYTVYCREADLSRTSNPLALGSNSTEVPLNTTFMTNPGNIPTTDLPCKECGDVKVGWDEANYIDGFHGAWLHFQRARVGVGIRCGCVQNKVKKRYTKPLSLVLKGISLKVKGPLHSYSLLIAHLPSGSRICT